MAHVAFEMLLTLMLYEHLHAYKPLQQEYLVILEFSVAIPAPGASWLAGCCGLPGLDLVASLSLLAHSQLLAVEKFRNHENLSSWPKSLSMIGISRLRVAAYASTYSGIIAAGIGE